MIIVKNSLKLKDNSEILLRKKKLKILTKKNNNISYPNNFKRNILTKELHNYYGDKSKKELEDLFYSKKNYNLTGRIILRRTFGKASFILLQDYTGKIQIYFKESNLVQGQYKIFRKLCDLGDIIGVSGTIFKTNTGELSIAANNFKVLTKAVRPLPNKFYGLSDLEIRYRQRYLDLIINKDSRKIFNIRSKAITFIRNYFNKLDFIEVETPMMHILQGGASAKPFNTYHNALNIPLYLRISPELYLKKLIIGGFERIYEINRNFRNEGISSRHNPEFTMLEFYMAYADYNDLMDLTEDMFLKLVVEIIGTKIINYGKYKIDFSHKYKRLSMIDSIIKYNSNIDKKDLVTFESAKKITEKLKIINKSYYKLGHLINEIFKKTVEHKLIQPTFITEYPVEVSPLARRKDNDFEFTDRFELFIGSYEIANGFSELNDSEDQSDRFKNQVKDSSYGYDEAMPYDKDYIKALEYGMPPAAGQGIGIDRLIMLLTNSKSIKDVILFPQMKPE